MTKAFHIALILFALTANTASAQSELTTTPQDFTILDLTYPSSYDLAPEPTRATEPTGELTAPENTPNETSPSETTTNITNVAEPVTTPTDAANANTDPDSIDSATFLVPPKRVLPQESPKKPRDCPEQTICPSAQEVIENTIPKITKNQWRVAIIVFGGSAAGGLIWLLTSLLFNNAHSKREQAIFQTRTTVKNNNHRIDQLKNSHNKISESIADLTETFKNGKNPSSQQIQSFKNAGIELELFGSSKTRTAYNKVLTSLSGTSNEKDFSAATKTLFSALKTDLGFK